MAATAAGAVVLIVAVSGIAGFGHVGHQLAAALIALPVGLLLLLAGADLLSRSTSRSPFSLPVVSLDEWRGTAQCRRHAAKAAFN